MTENKYAVLQRNSALAMGGAAAGVKFYAPIYEPLHRRPSLDGRPRRKAGIVVRQVEDEIGVHHMAIGAAHAGFALMCATSGGGFALMSEGAGPLRPGRNPRRRY